MVDPPHQLDLTEALRLLGESCGGDHLGYTTLVDELEADCGRRDRRIAAELRALTAAERLRVGQRLR